MKIKRIAQEHEYGCAVACLAMILGQGYDEVDRQFENDFNRKGIQIVRVRDYLIDHGLSVIEKKSHGSLNRKKHNQRMLQPFAKAHIVMFQPRADSAANHVVVMTQSGKILDPSPSNVDDVSEFYFVISVLGCFWD